ncbi:MAG: hypothetical protein E6Q97_17380 [Desulfurellales bacterium]|nr:MAG: hypothetical protein E6Q97_17380 [Desulfurellales bacterium]
MWNGTEAQRQALKAYVLATPALASLFGSGDYERLSNALNANSTPAFWIYKTSVTKEDFCCQVGPDGSLFNWSVYIARSLQELKAWDEQFSRGSMNPSLPNVPSAVRDIFSGGTAPVVAHRQHCLDVLRRRTTVAERVLVITPGAAIPGGTAGDGTKATPGQLGWSGNVDVFDINTIMAAP